MADPPDPRLLVAIALVCATLAVIAAVLAWRQYVRHREEIGVLRRRKERLKQALWATGERYWDYDLATQRVTLLETDRGDGSLRLHGMHFGVATGTLARLEAGRFVPVAVGD